MITKKVKNDLKSYNPEVLYYLNELEKENSKLQKQIARMHVKDITNCNKISALEGMVKKLKKRNTEIKVIRLPAKVPVGTPVDID